MIPQNVNVPSQPTFPVASPITLKQADKVVQPEHRMMDLNNEYIAQLQEITNGLMTDQGRRTATINELLLVVNTLREMDSAGLRMIDPAELDRQIQLDSRSPAGRAKQGKEPIEAMSVWNLLLTYDLCKEGDAKPATQAELKILIDKVETRNTSISSMSQTKAIELNRFISGRDQAFSMNANLTRQLMDLLLSILKQM